VHRVSVPFLCVASLLAATVPAAADPAVEAIPFASRDIPRRATDIAFADDDQIPNTPRSCKDILRQQPNADDGEYEIDAGFGPVTVHCDMETDGGGYTSVAVDDGLETFRSTDANSCHALGMDIVVPRTRAHWASLLAQYDTTYFSIVPGISKPAPGGNFTTIAMNSDEVPPDTWQALDGKEWWLRDTRYTEPNGDYTANCWLSMFYWVVDDLRFNDGSCSASATSYICSTNDKSSIGGNTLSPWIELGFDFPFFGQTYDRLRVSASGYLSFDATRGSCCNADVVPSGARPHAVISGFRGRLAPDRGGRVRWHTTGDEPAREWIVSFVNVPHLGSEVTASFQIVLRQDGQVEVHCEDCATDGSLHTQGIEDETGTVGISVRGRNYSDFSARQDAVAFRTDAEPIPEANWSIVGTVLRDPDAPGNLVVVAHGDDGELKRSVLVAPGLYSLRGLSAGEYEVQAFVDTNRNGALDMGEMTQTRSAMVPPDALNLDFDFRTAVEPDAGTDAGSDTADAEPDAQASDAGGDTEPDTPEADGADSPEVDAASDTTLGAGTKPDPGGCTTGGASRLTTTRIPGWVLTGRAR
jgi:hypothetical protein